MNGTVSTAVFLFVLFQLPLVSSQTTYYIKSTPQSWCPYDECLTLSEYASETTRYFNSDNLTLMFLPGEHTFNSSIVFLMFESLTLQGDLSSLPNITSKIVCEETSAIVLMRISKVEIKALSFNFCGNRHSSTMDIVAHGSYSVHGSTNSSKLSYNLNTMLGMLPINVVPSVSALFVSNFHLVSCHMEENYLPLFVNTGIVYIQDNQFLDNTGVYGGAIATLDSTIVSVGHNQFVDNTALEDGGGIFVKNGALIFRGSATFIHNDAQERGGGIRAINSSITFNRNFTDALTNPADCNILHNRIFLKNSAKCGGGVSLEHSIMRVMGGNLNFTENGAGDGGGVSSVSSHIFLDGFVKFESNFVYLNSGSGMGGAVAMWTSTWNCTMISFLENWAFVGGAVYSFDSRMEFNTHVGTSIPVSRENGIHCNKFVNNSATYHGGAIEVNYNSIIQFHGNNHFEQNSAGSEGGGIRAFYGRVNFKGHNAFIGNSSSNNCVGNAMELQKCYYNMSIDTGHDVSTFVQNKAQYGGGIFLKHSELKLNGEALHFFGNLAYKDGGGIMSTQSFITLDGIAMFKSNSAKYSGGAIYSVKSQVNFSILPHSVRTEHVSSQENFSLKVSIHFINNTAEYGGGLNAYEGTIEFNQLISNFDRNSATMGGGISARFSKIYFKGYNNSIREKHKEDITEPSNIHLQGYTTIFTSNSAKEVGGGIYAWNSTYIFSEEKVIFIGNKAELSGGGLYLTGSTFNNSGIGHYINNTAGTSGGFISTAAQDIVAFNGENVMSGNTAIFGGAVSVETGKLSLFGKSYFVRNKATYGGAIYIEGSYLMLSGNNSYDSNEAKSTGYGGYGGGIHAVRSKIEFSESHNFINNSARYGGGLAIAQYDWNNFLYFAPTSYITFSNNYAQKHGGAILIEDDLFTYCDTDSSAPSLELRLQAAWVPGYSTPGRNCFFSFSNTSKEALKYLYLPPWKFQDEWHYNLLKCIGQMKFVGNLAKEGGNNIYGGALKKCRLELTFQQQCAGMPSRSIYMSGLEAVAVITNTSIEEVTRDHSSIASDVFKVCICDSNKEQNCTQRTVHHITHPGATESFVLVTVGQANGTVPGVIHARFTEPQEAWLSPLQHTQNTKLKCTSLKYTLFSNSISSRKLDLYAEGPCGESGTPLSIIIKFLPCPDGFGMSQFGSCECDRRLQKYTTKCNITSKHFTRNGDFWVGFDNQSHDLILHPHCPFDYCKLKSVSFQLDSRDLQCAYGRSGTLCGACKSGLSLNLGSSQCSHCSNMFLFLLLAFAAAGFLLVIFLFTCEVTVAAGTTSCLIFYANVIAVNRTVFFPSGETNILTVFIAWLNLDLGIETCFFDGMDAYIRTWLQFVFPLYIWLLVGIIAFVSYYSTTFARVIGPTNPISVLATLFLLSYTKLLRTIIATFSSTSLDYPNGRSVTVWVFDGSVGFLEGKHIALFLAGLLVFLLLFLPYTLLLLFGQCIEARSNRRLLSWANSLKVKSFLDAYHAPYKNRHRYWTGLLLLLRFILFIISAVININSPRDPSVNLLVLAIACAGLLTWTLNTGSMFKKWYNNVLESSFIFNLAVLAAASFQVRVEGGNQAAVVYTSVGVAFVTFLGIITFHVVKRVTRSRVWKNSVRPALQPLWERLTHQQHHQDPIARVVPPTTHQPRPVTTTFIDLRESLLESQN